MRPATPEVSALIHKQEEHDLKFPQVPTAVGHRFAPGVYLRSIFMPAGSRVIGHKHKTTHFNIVLAGRCQVIDEDKVVELVAPFVFVSEAGTKKILNIIEDTIWATIHPTEETDISILEDALVTKSQAYLEYEKSLSISP